MKDYKSMSDFEIEVEVTKITTGHAPISAPSERQRVYIAKDFDNENYPPEDALQYIDVPRYCSIPADAWPIIVENDISLIKYENEKETMACVNPVAGYDFIIHPDFDFYSENPLRAAMIVFLMMQEQNQ